MTDLRSTIDTKISTAATDDLPNIAAPCTAIAELENLPLIPKKVVCLDLITPRAFIIIISLFNGLYQVRSIGEFLYQKEYLHLSPNIIQILLGVTTAPYTLKPIFGFLYDKAMLRFRKTKYIILVTSIVRIAVSACIAHWRTSWFVFTLFILTTVICEVFERIVCETSLVISTQQENRENVDKSVKANHLPVFFGFKSAGSFLGLFLGGRIVKYSSVFWLFFVSGFLPIFPLIACFVYNEISAPRVDVKKPIREEIEIMKNILSKPKVVAMALFIFLIHLTPSYDSITSFYLMDNLGFTAEDLADLSSCSLVAFILALVWYSYSLYKLPPKRIFMGTNFLLWLVNCSFLLVVFGVIKAWDISEKAFCLLNWGLNNLVAELNFMPILAIWCTFCPRNLEGTAITLFTALIALSYNFGTYFGIILSFSLGVYQGHLQNFWLLLVIQNAFLILVLLFVTAIGFPDPSEDEQQESVSTPLENESQAQQPHSKAQEVEAH